MARSRLPQQKAEVAGATYKNPGRFVDRKAPKRIRPVGEPYVSLSDDEAECWREFVADCPWLHASHRPLLLMASRLLNKVKTGTDPSPSTYQQLSVILSKLGATPADETKVNHGDDDPGDDSDRFFDGRPN